jgi:hypothetical protein
VPPIARRPIFALKQRSLPLALLLVGAFLFSGCGLFRSGPPAQTNGGPRVTQTGSNIPRLAGRPENTPAEENYIVIRGGFR